MLVTDDPGECASRPMVLSEPLRGVPPVQVGGQGGLLDIELDPRFADNRLLYLSYAEPADNGTASTAVAKARLEKDRLEGLQVIYRQQPKVEGDKHFGSRLVFARDGTLFITRATVRYREKAQDLSVGWVDRPHQPDGAYRATIRL